MKKLIAIFWVAVAWSLMTASAPVFAKKWDEITYEQTLEIKKGSTLKYTSSSGKIFTVGQEIILRAPANGRQSYTYAFTRAALAPPFPLSSAWDGARLKISKISWKQVQGVPNVVVNTTAEGASYGAGKQMIGNLEAAVETMEVVTSAEDLRPVTQKSPIEKLKEAKQLLDLEVISQEEYDAIKEKLMPQILGS